MLNWCNGRIEEGRSSKCNKYGKVLKAFDFDMLCIFFFSTFDNNQISTIESYAFDNTGGSA